MFPLLPVLPPIFAVYSKKFFSSKVPRRDADFLCDFGDEKKTPRRTPDEWQQFKFIRERKIRFKIGVFGISKKGVKFLDFPVATLLPVK